jgi:transposase-like protein
MTATNSQSSNNSNNQRKTYTPEQKLKIVLESFQRDTTIEAVRLKYGIASSVLHRWRDAFKKAQSSIAQSAFGDSRNPASKAIRLGYEPGQSPDELKKIIGEQTVQIEILKKVQGLLV